MKNVSVIVPIYNVESYLAQSLDSLLRQNRDLLEIILVNDGSTDDSLSVCYEYQKKYPEILIITKKNGGLSDARNEGIKVASGDYICFLDSDDWLEQNAISKLYDYAIQMDCDIVQGGFYYAYDTYLEYDSRWMSESDKSFTLNRNEAMEALIQNGFIKNFAWGKLYKTSIVKKHTFKIKVNFEDSYWQYHIINEATNYGVIPEPLYYYRQRRSSISGSFSLKSLDLLKGYEERLLFIKDHYPHLLSNSVISWWKLSFDFYRIAYRTKDENLKKSFSDYWEYVNASYLSTIQLAMKSSCFIDKLYYHLALHSPLLIPSFIFIKKVWNHFFLKPLTKIELQ